MITVTLQQIRDAGPCRGGWKKVLKANGGVKADFNKAFPLVSILDSNDLEDTLWVILEVPELSEHDIIWIKFMSWCALQNVEKIKPHCSNKDYDLIVEYLETNDMSLRKAVGSAVDYAYCSAAKFAAKSAKFAAKSAKFAAKSAWYALEYVTWSNATAKYSAGCNVMEYSAKSAYWDNAATVELTAAKAAYWEAARSAQENKLRELLGG